MRKALNSNPIAQVGAIAVLGLLVAFLLLGTSAAVSLRPTRPTRQHGRPGGGRGRARAGGRPTRRPRPRADRRRRRPRTRRPRPPAVPTDPAAADGQFKAGPGLPEPVVNAYESGDTVVLLVNRGGGIDDHVMRIVAPKVKAIDDVAFFETNARDVANYSRIAEGVDIDRVPALVVLSPKSVSGKGSLPIATIDYGFRDVKSVLQAVHDARYDGKTARATTPASGRLRTSRDR